MPTRDPVDRLPPTDNKVHLLLDLTIAGCTYRIADEYLEITDEDGSTLAYVEGLDLDYEEAAPWFVDSLGEGSFPVSIVVADVDWAALHAAGHDLAAGTASLSRWVEGDTYGQRQLLTQGLVSEPTFGAQGEPLAFSVTTAPLEDAGSWPPADAVIDLARWPHAHETAVGKMYPWIFGCPGWLDEASDAARYPGSPAYCIDTQQDRWVIAGHPINEPSGTAPGVWWRNMADPTSTWQLAGAGSGATGLPDGHGFTISWIENLSLDLDGGVDIDVWVSWAPLACGELINPAAASFVNNDHFTVSDGVTSITFEFKVSGGFVAVGGRVTIDISGVSTKEAVRDAMLTAFAAQTWTIVSHAGPNTTIAPIRSRCMLINSQPGTTGNVSITEAVADPDFAIPFGMEGGEDPDSRGGLVGRNGAIERAGDLLEWWFQRSTLAVDYGALAAVRSVLNTYRLSGYVDEPCSPWSWIQAHLLPILPLALVMGPRGLTPIVWAFDPASSDAIYSFDVDELEAERVGVVEIGDPSDVVNQFTLRWCLQPNKDEYVKTSTLDGTNPGASYPARVSAKRYGPRAKTLETDLIYDGATAGRVLSWMAGAFCAPAAKVVYQVQQKNALHLTPGDVVAVTDSELHLDAALHHLVGVRDEDSGTLELTLRSLIDPSRT